LAAKVGLGTNDPDKINIVGESIDKVKKKVIKNQSAMGLFGQSNRTWLLSPAYSATSITTEPITNEADIEPIPGKDGWSMPVYFFDDRIDLLSYYSGQTNIITYAFTYFYAPKTQSAELWIGSHEGIYVYINGTKVYEFTGTNSYGNNVIKTEIKPITINKGYNKLLVKTLNNTGDYTFALNICEVESDINYAGNRVDGLKFMTDTSSTVSNSSGNITANVLKISCYPNPAAVDNVNIAYEIPNSAKTTIDAFDINGKHIAKIFDSYTCAGNYNIKWNIAQRNISGGTYFIVLKSGKNIKTTRLIVK